MATELDLLTLTQLQKLAQSQQNQNQLHQPDTNLTTAGSWIRYPKAPPYEPDDDSWEVRAFAEDTSNAMGTTWPPRSYTCSFCRREFRSAQALGGHMNVHRRDRAARLHQTQPVGGTSNVALINTNSSSSTLLMQPTQEFATNGGFCFLYQLHNPNEIFTSPRPMNAYPSYNLMAAAAATSINIPVSPPPVSSSSSSFCYSTKVEHSMGSADNNLDRGKNMSNCPKETFIEELDLELRLGHSCPTTSS